MIIMPDEDNNGTTVCWEQERQQWKTGRIKTASAAESMGIEAQIQGKLSHCGLIQASKVKYGVHKLISTVKKQQQQNVLARD